MKFEEALVEIRKGKKIKLPGWNGIFERTLQDFWFKITLSEILSEQWEVIEEPGKTFPEVFEAFKEGNKIKRKIWRNYDYLSLEANICSIGKDDLLATDWEVIE